MRHRNGSHTRIAFDALSIEGALLPADWLAKVAQLDADAQAPDDYRIPTGLQIRDEIARSWRIAQACFSEMEAGRASGGNPRGLALRFAETFLRDALHFSSLHAASALVAGEREYPVSFATFDGQVPVVVAPLGEGLDTPLAELGNEGRRRSAFRLLQEALNASEDALWGLATDGASLRIARDNASLTRPAWIEADLARILTEDLYPDFAALWLVAHESRFGSANGTDACPLEAWRETSRQEGTRARDRLSAGFQDALEILGRGFLAHPANKVLRSALHSGRLSSKGFFEQLLRVVYRFVFLLTAEERDLLHTENTPASARALYDDGYSICRLRDRATRRSAHDRQSDLWEGVRIVFLGLAEGEPRLGLPALAGLFGQEECPDLAAARLENHALVGALFRLAWLREPNGISRVNWRDMGPDELGYVYEGLLELVPQVTLDGSSFSFTEGDESRGHERKMTGSYFTPDELVQLLLKSALDPVVQRTVDGNPEHPVDALLELTIVDPACGSGHFLLAAARRLADRVAHIRADGSPAPADYQRALRDVVRRCIYGVDRNPMAVELCKVGLWMESIDPGLPLTFLESHIRCGNSLVGTRRELMGDEVPDAAWTALSGDDRRIVRLLKRQNREEARGQRRLDFQRRDKTESLRDEMFAIEQADDGDASALARKHRRWESFLASPAFEREKLVADAWCAAFVWPKTEAESLEIDVAPTTARWQELRGNESPPIGLVETTSRLAAEYGFFHWELAFPHVFARGGFDVVLGNPPWERIKLQEQEFFAKRDPSIAKARNAAARKQLIAALPVKNPPLWNEWTKATRLSQGQSHFVRQSGRYPLCGKGDVNTYALFAEHNWQVLAPRGGAGFIVPSGILTDDTTKGYFQALLDRRTLANAYHFENEGLVFKGLHHAYRFVLLTIGKSQTADLVFYARRAVDLDDQKRHFELTPEDFATLNPNTRTCPTFRSWHDAKINLAMYRCAGVLWRENDPDGNPWGLRFLRMFDMANDSGLFGTRRELISAGWTAEGDRFQQDGKAMLPLYEAKMIHLFDHRFGTYEGQSTAQANQGKLPELDNAAHADPRRVTRPRYWVDEDQVATRLNEVWDRGWMLGWRDITFAGNMRTVIASIFPTSAANHKLPLAMPTADPQLVASLYANLSSIAFDYCARQKVGATNLSYFIIRQLPAFRPETYASPAPWAPSIRTLDWILPRVVELTYTSWNLMAFAEDCGDDGPPYLWDPERRFVLRCEIDAAFFHLYGIGRDDVGYILDTFPVLAQIEQREHGEYRTKRVVLETYDALVAATSRGQCYESPLGRARRAE